MCTYPQRANMADPCSLFATHPVDSSPRLAVLGVISSPANEGRRNWMRRFQAGRPDLLLRFVIGAIGLPVQQCRRLLREERAHGGMFLVPASDNAEVGCVDKSFAWLMAAVEAFPATRFIIKTDDDSATNMADLAALLSMRELQSHPHVYAGWAQYASALPATWQQCGWGASPGSALRKQQNCASGAEGPFVFATGALEILSSKLARKVFGSECVDDAGPNPSPGPGPTLTRNRSSQVDAAVCARGARRGPRRPSTP